MICYIWYVFYFDHSPLSQLVAMQYDPANRKQQLNQLLTQLQDVMQPTDMSDCGGYVTTYGFLVDYFSCPFREEVSWVIISLCNVTIFSRDFTLLGH